MTETKVRVKICDVEDFETAKTLEELQVDFIGVHMIKEVKYKKLELLAKCRANLNGLVPVVVTGTKDLGVIKDIVKSDPAFIQLHSAIPWSEKELEQLWPITRPIKLIGVHVPEDLRSARQELESTAAYYDFVLFDKSSTGGTGETIDRGSLREAVDAARKLELPFFIAGGLNVENVSEYVGEYNPYGVDVQTGVDLPGKPGQKDFGKIREFVRRAKGY
jgi:phosphoribosylanthranilate isomerase